MLRETVKGWECGLKGEIDWYDLLLINAIRVAEPGVFEWIARDPNVFLEEPARLGGNRDQEREARYARELANQLEIAVSDREPKRLEAVKKVLAGLFPYFSAKLQLGVTGYLASVAPHPWSQNISLQAGTHSDYLRRFFAGCVPPNDVPDQPTLRYIRAIAAKGFDPGEFTRSYLDSVEKLTGPLNKVVQFAGLITPELAYQICDIMLDWIADPAHAKTWPEPQRFMIQTLPDVFAIVDQAGSSLERRAVRDRTTDERRANERYEWVEVVIKKYMPAAPLLSLSFARRSGEKGYARVIEQLPGVVFREFTFNFIEKGLPLLPGLTISRFSLAWLLDDLLFVVIREKYSAIRSVLTKVLLSQTEGPDGQQMMERIIFSLVETLQPARSGEIPIEEYQFNVNRSANETRYDMNLVFPALRSWSAVQADRLTEKALSHLKHAYDLA